MFRCVKIKKGELNISSPFFETLVLSAQLERVSPVEKHVVPVAAETGSAIRNSRGADSIAQTQVLPCLVDVVAQVRRTVPQDVDADVHPRCNDVPDVPLP